MAIKYHHRALPGASWRYGWALGVHTLSSIRLPYDGFRTERSEIGELLYQLKYQHRRENVEPLADAAADFLRSRWILPSIAAIIPIPPSDVARPFQPVREIAVRIGEKLEIPVLLDYVIKTRRIEPMKNIEDAGERKKALKDVFVVKNQSMAGKTVLVFDDLFESGSTMAAVCDALVSQGNVARHRLYFLTLTATRTTP